MVRTTTRRVIVTCKKAAKHFLCFMVSTCFNIKKQLNWIQMLPFSTFQRCIHPFPSIRQPKSLGTLFRVSHRMSLWCSSCRFACTRDSSLHQWLCCWRWRELYRRVALCPTNGRGGRKRNTGRVGHRRTPGFSVGKRVMKGVDWSYFTT